VRRTCGGGAAPLRSVQEVAEQRRERRLGGERERLDGTDDDVGGQIRERRPAVVGAGTDGTERPMAARVPREVAADVERAALRASTAATRATPERTNSGHRRSSGRRMPALRYVSSY
jgi:hypothetical protein